MTERKVLESKLPKLVSDIGTILHLPVQFSGCYERPIDWANFDYRAGDTHKVEINLKNYSSVSFSLKKYYEYIHRWFPANPSKYSSVQRANEVYLSEVALDNKLKNFTAANTIIVNDDNAKNRVYNIERILNDSKYIIVEGNKGVGKTAFFNFWLNNRTDFLENHMNLIWFRVDASKLYECWSKNKLSKDEFTLSDYHISHAVYVLLKQRLNTNTNSNLSKAFDALKEQENQDIDLYHALGSLINTIESIDDDEYNTEKFLSSICKGKKQNQIKIVYRYFINFLKTINLKIMFILDGIDNISWLKGVDDPNYIYLCHEVGKLLNTNFEKSVFDDFSKVIIVVRPETYADIIYHTANNSMNYDSEKSLIRCIILSACTDKILNHKSNVAINPESALIISKKDKTVQYIEEGQEGGGQSVDFKKKIRSFSTFSKNYSNNLIKSIQYKYNEAIGICKSKNIPPNLYFNPSSFENSKDVLQIIFNNNIRAYTDNFIENHATIELGNYKGVRLAGHFTRYSQYLLLNGRYYLDTPHINERYRGEAFPNIFWACDKWETPFSKNWTGLSGLRVLQFMSLIKKAHDREYLLDVISDLFDLEKNVISNQISRFIKFGLIKTKEVVHSNGGLYIQLAPKGQFMLEFPFISPDWLYFFALDARLDETFKGDDKYIKYHRDDEFDSLENFNSAFVTTIITFTRHIITQQNLDIERLKERYVLRQKNDRNLDILTKEACVDAISLPLSFVETLQKYITNSCKGLIKFYPSEFENLYDNIYGAYKERL